MTVRDLLEAITSHAEDGRTLDEEVLVRVDGRLHRLTSSYMDGSFVLVAGMPV